MTKKEKMEQIERTRSEYMEKFAAAFLKETGSEKASQYKLVERHDGHTIEWSFEPKSSIEVVN